MQVIYDPKVNFSFPGLSYFHPANLQKYADAYKELKGKLPVEVVTDTEISSDDILRVHTSSYHDRVFSGDSRTYASAAETHILSRVPRFLIRKALLQPVLAATCLTLYAVGHALHTGETIVCLGGGFHHAKPDSGEGFCILNDVAIAIAAARVQYPKLGNVAYIDLDAHMGNGVAHCLRKDRKAHLFDMYMSEMYPQGDDTAEKRLNVGLPLTPSDSKHYLTILREHLPDFLEAANPILIIVNVGQDVFKSDPLTYLGLTPKDIAARDTFVAKQAHAWGVPTVYVAGGGYTEYAGGILANTAKAVYRVSKG